MHTLSSTEIFSETGLLKQAAEYSGRSYEYRAQQQEMAEAVEKSLLFSSKTVIEAPTGTGKSFAYLVPAINHALSTGKPVVISTETISLQEQIISKDIPALQQALGIELNAVLAKGRGNYLCMRRMNSAASRNMDYLPSDDLIPEIDQIYYWSKTAQTGCRSELNFKVAPEAWGAVNSEEGNCLNQACPHYKPCFFQNSRRQLREAQIIVANHAILFSDLALKAETPEAESGILPDYGALILDEAHTVESSAAMNLGLRMHSGSIFKVLHRVYHPSRKRGLLARGDEKFHTFFDNFYRHCKHWFDYVEDFLETAELPHRYREPGALKDGLFSGFLELEKYISEFIHAEEDEEKIVELTSVNDRCRKIRTSIDFFVNMRDDNFVYWFDSTGQNNESISLNAVPIDIAPLLQNLLWLKPIPIILTSATLAVNNSLDYYKKRIGLESSNDLILSSPFNYSEQVEKYFCRNMPNPNDTENFLRAVVEKLEILISKTAGKAFVLFTSYKMMNNTANIMRPWLEVNGWNLLKQGDGLSNLKLVEEFKKDINSVLFGTHSFWTGIDVPGESLSNVIIVKLPFAVPDHPVVQAKIENITQNGGNSFMDYSVPEAVLKLRQGAGRLIRSKTDKGIIAVLDGRLHSKFYGKVFLNSLPQSPVNFL
ncbi:MAG: DEAD/DEAH box helicase [Lentisphaeraceae bacterium]|nr:DEAD/DEAH box helicase [Lentisphaeraceae bacterium]